MIADGYFSPLAGVCAGTSKQSWMVSSLKVKLSARNVNLDCIYIWIKYNLGQKYYAQQVRLDRDSNSGPPDHDSTFHVTEMPALTTWPSVTSPK